MPPTSATSASPVRERSREALLALIAEHAQGVTRAELAARSGISRSAVTSAVTQLLAHGLVVEAELEPKGPGAGPGRPATLLFAAPTTERVGGIDFGHNHIAAAVADSNGDVLLRARVEHDVDMDASAAIERGVQLLHELMESSESASLASVVCGIPGPVDARTGMVNSATILSGWVDIRPAEEIGTALGQDVFVENDAFLGAYAETRLGAGLDHPDFLYVKVSHGVGAALVLGGVPYRGASGIAGEIGHTKIPGRVELCRCGDTGCLESVVSVESVRRQLTHTHPLLQGGGTGIPVLDDPVARRILHQAGRTLGLVLTDFCNLLNPSAVVVGGELGSADAAFAEGVLDSLQRGSQPAIAEAIEVSRALWSTDNEVVGATLLAAERAREAYRRRALLKI